MGRSIHTVIQHPTVGWQLSTLVTSCSNYKLHADSGLDGCMQDALLSFGSIYNSHSFRSVVDDFHDEMCTLSKSRNTSLGADCSACSPQFGSWQLSFLNQCSDVNTESNIITGIASSWCFTWAPRHTHCTSSCVGVLG